MILLIQEEEEAVCINSMNENETNKDKANRILSKSLLFYQETGADSPAAKVEKEDRVDTTKYQLFVDSVVMFYLVWVKVR